MDTRSLCQLCLLMVIIFLGVTEAVWTLTGSSEFAVADESFTLTCNPQDTSGFAKSISWRRSGTLLASIDFISTCNIGNGSDQQYQYTCEPGPIYKLTIPANVMTNSQNNIVWKCDSQFGGTSNTAEYTLTVADAVWTLTGSSEFAAAGESFTLTCNPQDTSNLAKSISWRRSGTLLANIDYTSTCNIESGADQQYQYTCEPGPIYKLTIPVNVMTNSQNNIVWRCGSLFGGTGNNAQYTLTVAVAVSNVIIDGDSGYPNKNVIYENTPKTFTCITSGCRPKANITVTTTGVTEVQRTERQSTQSDGLIVTTVTQTITATRGGGVKTIQCSAVNIQGRQLVTSQTVTLDVYYTPIIFLDKKPVVVSEGQSFSRTCSAIGNPTPTVNWYRDDIPYTSSTGTSATLIIQTVTRNDTGTYTCKAAPTGNQRQIFTNVEDLQIYVYYLSINKPAPVCSSSESISISCCSVINATKPLRFHGWTHRIGNTNIRSFDGNLLSTNNNSLSIDYCGYYDSGIYTCEASVDINNNNTWQHFNSSIEIIVPAPPVVSSNSVKDKVADNRMTMSVQFYSVPKPVIVEWNKDGKKLTFSNKYQQKTSVTNVTLLFDAVSVKIQGYESSLSILNPDDKDFGSYIFKIQNSEGSAQIELQLNKHIVDDNHHGNVIGAVVGGVMAFIVIISITTIVICILRRRRKNQNSCSGNQAVSKAANPECSTDSNKEDRSYQDIQMYETLDSPCTAPNQYETLSEQQSCEN